MTLSNTIVASALSTLPKARSLQARPAPSVPSHRPMVDRADPPFKALQLTSQLPALDSEADTRAVLDFFATHTTQDSVAVLDGDVPIGLISKGRFISRYARELAMRSVDHMLCTSWVEIDALVVDGHTSASQLLEKASQLGRHAFVDGFVVTVNGRYAGMGSGTALRNLRLEIEAEAERERLTLMDFAYPLLQHLHFVSHDHLGRALLDHHALVQSRDAFGGDSVFVRVLGQGMLLGVLRGVRGGESCFETNLSAQLCLDTALEALERSGRPIVVGELLGQLHRMLQADNAQAHAASDLQGDSAMPGHDGLQVGLVWLPHHRKSLQFAGAHSALRAVRPGSLDVRQRTGSHVRVGQVDVPSDTTWATQELPLGAVHRVILVTDGVTGLVGGPFDEPLSGAQITRFLRTHSTLKASDAGQMFENMLARWQGPRELNVDLASFMFTAGQQGYPDRPAWITNRTHRRSP